MCIKLPEGQLSTRMPFAGRPAALYVTKCAKSGADSDYSAQSGRWRKGCNTRDLMESNWTNR